MNLPPLCFTSFFRILTKRSRRLSQFSFKNFQNSFFRRLRNNRITSLTLTPTRLLAHNNKPPCARVPVSLSPTILANVFRRRRSYANLPMHIFCYWNACAPPCVYAKLPGSRRHHTRFESFQLSSKSERP